MMNGKAASIALALVAMLVPVPSGGSASEQTELVESLRAAEISFANSLAEKDFERFGSHIDPEAIFVGGQVLAGKEAILEVWKNYFAEDAPTLEWHPEDVAVRKDGRMGITKGPYTLRSRTPDGQEQVRTGSFSSIWEMQEDGEWRILFDSGCAPCPSP